MAYDSLIPDGFPNQYNDEWSLQLQQMTARLAAFVNIQTIHGEGFRFQRLPKVEARQITTRFGDTNPDDIPAEYRWLYVNFKDSAHIIDRRESIMLGSVSSPHSSILRLQAAAAARDMDRTLVDGIRGSAQTGKTGTTLVPLPSASIIGANFQYSAGTDTKGMTFDKLLECATRFGISNVLGQDTENQSPGCVVLTHREVKDLLLEEKLVSADYGIRRLMDGQVVNVFGLAIKAVDASILPFDSVSGVRKCYAFARDFVAFGVAENPTAFVDVLPSKRHDTQLRTEWGWGCTRLDEEGVIEIEVDTTPGA